MVECESLPELNSTDILVLCETNLDDSIDFGNFCEELPSFNPKGFYYSYMHGLAVYVKEGNSVDSDLCFQLALLHFVSSFFSVY